MAERNTPRRTGGFEYMGVYKVKASTTIEAGKMVLLDVNGLAVEGAKAANHISVGRAEESATAGASGDTFIRVRMGIFRWNNDVAGKSFARASIGDAAYVEDDETVRTNADSSGVIVGRVVDVDDEGAWVATGHLFG